MQLKFDPNLQKARKQEMFEIFQKKFGFDIFQYKLPHMSK